MDATTVSRRISRLEADISETLFEHRASGHILTPRGQALLDHAQSMESAAIAATGNTGGQSGLASGVIRLSVSEGFGHWVIAPKLRSFTDAYPGITIELIASSGLLNPSRREADVSIMLSRPKKGPLIVRRLIDYRLGLYANKDDRACNKVRKTSDLKNQRLIGYVPDLIYSPELRYLEEVTGGLDVTLASSSITAQSILIEHAAGIGILPCFIGDKNKDMKRLLSEDISIKRSFWLVMHRDMQKVARIRLFVDWLLKDGIKDDSLG